MVTMLAPPSLAAALPDLDAPAPAVAVDASTSTTALRATINRGRPVPVRPPAWRLAPPPAGLADRAAAGSAQRDADFAEGQAVPEGEREQERGGGAGARLAPAVQAASPPLTLSLSPVPRPSLIILSLFPTHSKARP